LNQLALALVSVAVAASLGCSKKRTTAPSDLEPQRNGGELTEIGVQFTDLRPVLAADGTKVVFVSGRESTGDAASLKAFKVDWPEGGEPGKPARVTASDIGDEREAVISPDGKWVAIVAVKDGKSDVYLIDYAGEKDPVAVTDDDAVESGLAFSPASAGEPALLWVSRQGTKATPTVGAVGGGSADDVKVQAPLDVGDARVSAAFWAPSSAEAGYQVAIGVAPANSAGLVDFQLRSFASVAAAKEAEPEATPWIQGTKLHAAVAPAAGAGHALLVRKLNPADADLLDRVGDYVVEDEDEVVPYVQVKTEPFFAKTAASDELVEFKAPPGYDVLGVGMAADGTSGVIASRRFYRCAGDDDDVYGVAIGYVAALDGAAPKDFVPRYVSAGKWEVAKDLCDRKAADESVKRLDDKIVGVAMAADGTASNLRVAYVSRFVGKFDADCELKTGDSEIRALSVKDDEATISELSANPADIQDDERDEGDAPCAL
jgi:hypothetical protein